MVPAAEYTRWCVLQLEAPDGAFSGGIHPMVCSATGSTRWCFQWWDTPDGVSHNRKHPMVPAVDCTRWCALQLETPDGAFNNRIHPMVSSKGTPKRALAIHAYAFSTSRGR